MTNLVPIIQGLPEHMQPANQPVSNLGTYLFAIGIILLIGTLALSVYSVSRYGVFPAEALIEITAGTLGAAFILYHCVGGILDYIKHRKKTKEVLLPTPEPKAATFKKEFFLKEGFSEIPEDVGYTILSFLDFESMKNSSLVCRSWAAYVHDPKLLRNVLETIPSMHVIGPDAWAKHGFSFEEGFAMARGLTILTLLRFASLPIEGDAGFTLLAIPEGLSYNKLIEISGNGVMSIFQEDLGELSTQRSCSILISNALLEESREKSMDEQKALIQGYGCEMPGFLDVAALIFMSEERLFYPFSYTRCSEQINGNQIAVGGYGENGIAVTHHPDGEACGMAALLKF